MGTRSMFMWRNKTVKVLAKFNKGIYRWLLNRSRVYGSLVIPKWIDKSKVTVMSDVYITHIVKVKTYFIL